MNEYERRKEHRTWKIWEYLSTFFSFFGFKTRPGKSYNKGGELEPKLKSKSPTLALNILADEGAPIIMKVQLDRKDEIQLILKIFRYVIDLNGDVSDKDKQFVSEHFDNILSDKVTDAEKQEYSEYFESLILKKSEFKYTVQQFKFRSKMPVRLQFINGVFELAYVHGITDEMQIEISEIAKWLEIPSVELRRAAFDGRKKHESK